MVKRREIDETAVGTKIYRWRKELGLTVKQLADRTNLETAWLIQLERGELDLPVDASLLLRVAEALKTTIADLYGLPITRINEKGEFIRGGRITNVKIRWILQRRVFIKCPTGNFKQHFASHKRESRAWRVEKLDKRRIDFAKEWATNGAAPREPFVGWRNWEYVPLGIIPHSYTYKRESKDGKLVLKLELSLYCE